MGTILVLTSTYPRWERDIIPDFVHELCKHLALTQKVVVLAPYMPNAPRHVQMDGVDVYRFKYWISSKNILTGGQSILPTLRKNPKLWLQVPLFLVCEIIATSRMIRRVRPSVVHAHWLIPQGLCAIISQALSRHKCRVVCTIHGTDIFGLQKVNWLKRHVWNRIDGLTMVSHAIAKEVQRIGITSSTQTAVISMGVDAKLFSPDKYNQQIKERHDISGPFLLFVGRLTKPKGLRYLLEAMPRILQSFSAAKLLIIGAGEEQKILMRLRDSLNISESNVSFLGALPKEALPSYYATADIFIGPSIETPEGDREGFGITFIEAMASQTHVIGTDLKNFDDYLTDGVTGYRVKQRDPVSLAEKILDILKNPAPTVPVNARKFVIDNFDWMSIAKLYSAFLQGDDVVS